MRIAIGEIAIWGFPSLPCEDCKKGNMEVSQERRGSEQSTYPRNTRRRSGLAMKISYIAQYWNESDVGPCFSGCTSAGEEESSSKTPSTCCIFVVGGHRDCEKYESSWGHCQTHRSQEEAIDPRLCVDVVVGKGRDRSGWKGPWIFSVAPKGLDRELKLRPRQMSYRAVLVRQFACVPLSTRIL
jgi:hypothetical protein